MKRKQKQIEYRRQLIFSDVVRGMTQRAIANKHGLNPVYI